jgi:nucleoside-diphosphate-sugar epimerase
VKVLVSGAYGFIGGYLVSHLLDQCSAEVVALDNFSKYGEVARRFDGHPRLKRVEGDAKDSALLEDLLQECDHFIAAAAMIGGISYFHEYAYDLLAENERIMAASFDAAIHAHRNHQLKKITVLSSSMVYENAMSFPTKEGDQRQCPPPTSTYGFQKLACEYYARGAWEQYQLPFTICRPFNCVGIGEARSRNAREIFSGNVKLAMSHVVPDLVQKVLRGQKPLHLLGSGCQVRCYTYGGDLARGIAMTLEHPAARNEDFNLSTPVRTTVLELAELIWRMIHGPGVPFEYVCDTPYPHDVAYRVPDVSKAEQMLGFVADTPLEAILNEVIPWIRAELRAGRI